MKNSSRRKILDQKKERKIMARLKSLNHNPKDVEDKKDVEESKDVDDVKDIEESKDIVAGEESVVAEESSPSDESPPPEETTTPEEDPVVIESAIPDDIERLLKRIKMEITFSDESTIQKEIVISHEESKETKAPDEAKMPWVTVVILAIIVCASLATGVYHWYNSYFLPDEIVEPAHITGGEGRDPVDRVDDQEIKNTEEEAGQDVPEQPDQSTGHRYPIEPLPEFLLLWEEHGNEDIVAVLTLGEEEFLVVQGYDNAFYITHDINRELSSHGWIFLDHQVDLYTGYEHNMVIYDPVGEFLRQIIQEFASYDFFLKNPVIKFSTLFGEFEWEIFSYYIAPSDFPFSIVNHPDDDIWGEMVEQFTKASLYNTRLDVNMDDQILTIAVPTTIDPELFYILQARMLRQITS